MVKVRFSQHSPGSVCIHCPGCGFEHFIPLVDDKIFGKVWNFDGNVEFPSITPGIDFDYSNRRCHFIIIKGKIKYYPDTTHKFSDLTIDLPEIQEGDTTALDLKRHTKE